MTREIVDAEKGILTISPEPRREGDFWPTTCWKNTENTEHNPTLIAAKCLAGRGFGITFDTAFDVYRIPIPSRIAIHTTTPYDRKVLEEVDSAPEVRGLQRTVWIFKHEDNPISWRLNAEQVVEQLIDRKKLKPKSLESQSEEQEVLRRAVKEVSLTYMVCSVDSLAPTQTKTRSKERDPLWDSAAQDFPMFRGRILELRKRLKVNANTERAYSPGIGKNTLLGFMEIKDKTAALLLGDILLSRQIAHEGYLDQDDVLPWEEISVMASEMGLQGGYDAWKSEQAKGITLEQVVEKVLSGDLRITYQPKSLR